MPGRYFNPLALNPGTLRHQITIQAQSTTQDASTGEPSSVWNDVHVARAAIDTVSAMERYQRGTSAEFVAQVSHMVTMRWPGASVSIAGGMRVLFGSRAFTIQAVENVEERNRVMKLSCVEVNGSSNGGAGCS